jgi:hypothetical protein
MGFIAAYVTISIFTVQLTVIMMNVVMLNVGVQLMTAMATN